MRAAREVFAARGIDAPLSAVARRAGTSVATLYRRFPTRDDLVTTAFTEQLSQCTTALREALAHPDPWYALRTLVNQICSMQCADRGFSEAFFLRHPHFTDDRVMLAQAQLGTLVQRCQAIGRVHADVTGDDIVLLLVANAGLVASTPEPHRASARLAAHFLRAFEAHHGSDVSPLPPLGVQGVLPQHFLRGAHSQVDSVNRT
ncbi:MAG: hypothetical protein K0R68_1625 [Mycobacterium sp.]|nr:hypothetical protein [Mycobacterium sp.]